MLREVLEGDGELRALQERLRSLPEDATYYDRVKLGELIVAELERRREVDAGDVYERLKSVAIDVAPHTPGNPKTSSTRRSWSTATRPKSSKMSSRLWASNGRAGSASGCWARWLPTTS